MKVSIALKFIMCLAVTFSAPLIASLFTRQAISDWYAELNKPFFTPPDWVFGPLSLPSSTSRSGF